jgi:hypothetical protein
MGSINLAHTAFVNKLKDDPLVVEYIPGFQ